MRITWPFLLCSVLIAGGMLPFLYSAIENFFIYHPSSSLDFTPEDFHLNHEDVVLTTEDGVKLHGWLFARDRRMPVLLFCHGNAGNISHRLDLIRLLLKNNLQVFIFDYRGYGKSSGSPSEQGLYVDGIAAYDYLVRKGGFDSSNVVPFGRSLGAAVALEIALNRRVRAVILEGAFTSTRDMAKTIPLFAALSPLLPSHYNNLEKIGSATVPKLFIHGEKDEVAPLYMGRRLFEEAKAPKDFVLIRHARHNDTYLTDGGKYFDGIVRFTGRGECSD